MSKKGSIFIIKNSINGKVFLGSTLSYAKDRFNSIAYSAFSHIKNRIGSLAEEIFHYGIEKFTMEIIEAGISDPEELLAKAEYYHKKFLDAGIPLYNTKIRTNVRSFSEEHRQKLAEARLGKTWDEDTKAKMAKAKIGKPRSEETKRKISMTKRAKKQPIQNDITN